MAFKVEGDDVEDMEKWLDAELNKVKLERDEVLEVTNDSNLNGGDRPDIDQVWWLVCICILMYFERLKAG